MAEIRGLDEKLVNRIDSHVKKLDKYSIHFLFKEIQQFKFQIPHPECILFKKSSTFEHGFNTIAILFKFVGRVRWRLRKKKAVLLFAHRMNAKQDEGDFNVA